MSWGWKYPLLDFSFQLQVKHICLSYKFIDIFLYLVVYTYHILPAPSQVKQCLLQLLHYPYAVHKLWWSWEFQQCDPHPVLHLSELCRHSPLYKDNNVSVNHKITSFSNTNIHLCNNFIHWLTFMKIFFSLCSYFCRN